jgi:hypothetical protein
MIRSGTPIAGSLLLAIFSTCAVTSAPIAVEAAPNLSERAFGEFRSICLDNDGNADASIATADRRGWAPLTPTLRKDLSEGYPIKGTFQGRLLMKEGAAIILSVRRLEPNNDVPFRHMTCHMTIIPGDYAALSRLCTDWARTPPIPPPNKDVATQFIFFEKGKVRIPMTQAQMDYLSSPADYRGKKLVKLIVSQDGPSASLHFLTIPG